MMDTYMHGTYSSVWGLLLNILLILLVVWIAVTFMNRSGNVSSENGQRLARVEKDVEDIILAHSAFVVGSTPVRSFTEVPSI